MNKFFIKDSKGEKSLTATIFFFGSLVCFAKLILSGITVDKFAFAVFSGSDFALSIGALGSIYSLRRSKLIKDEK